MNRPTYNYGHPIVAWNGRGLGSLGDDSSTFLSLGFNSAQIQQITSAHQSGALSDGGYQALLSGFVGPDDLADFMAADPGASVQPTTSAPAVAVSNVNTTLTPRPSPTVAAPNSFSSSFSSIMGTSFAGIPLSLWLMGLMGILLIIPEDRRRR